MAFNDIFCAACTLRLLKRLIVITRSAEKDNTEEANIRHLFRPQRVAGEGPDPCSLGVMINFVKHEQLRLLLLPDYSAKKSLHTEVGYNISIYKYSNFI